MTLPGLVAANNLNDVADQEKAWDNLGSNVSAIISISAPFLDLNFANNKSLIDDVSGQNLITFSRASTGTFIGSNGLLQTAASGVPRFDYDSETGESLGLLIEESKTNHCLHSDIGPTNWVQNGTSSLAVSSVPAPDGGTCYDLTTDTGGPNSVRQQSNTSAPVGTSVLSVFARFPDAGFTSLAIRNFSVGGGANYYADYRPATDSWHGEVDCTGLPSEDLGNGWKRLTVVSTVTSSNGNNWVNIGGGVSSPAFTQQTCQIWGAQLEQRNFPTSLIPTSGSAVTRSPDIAQMTGDNFSSWYNGSEGTVFADFISSYAAGSNTTVASINNGGGGTSERISLRPRNTIYGATSIAGLTVGETPPNVSNKIAWSFDTSGLSLISGSSSDLYNSALASQALTQLDIGMWENANANFRISGTISRLTYWPSRLADAALQHFTLASTSSFSSYPLNFTTKGKDILALIAVRNVSVRDFIFIKGLLSPAQPRLTVAAQNTTSGTVLRDYAMPKLSPTTAGNYFFSSSFALSGTTLRVNGTNALSIATSPFSGSTATAPLLLEELRPQSNWRITEPMPSGALASPEFAIPYETNDFVLFMKAGQN